MVHDVGGELAGGIGLTQRRHIVDHPLQVFAVGGDAAAEARPDRDAIDAPHRHVMVAHLALAPELRDHLFPVVRILVEFPGIRLRQAARAILIAEDQRGALVAFHHPPAFDMGAEEADLRVVEKRTVRFLDRLERRQRPVALVQRLAQACFGCGIGRGGLFPVVL